jgi:hypothetical protein
MKRTTIVASLALTIGASLALAQVVPTLPVGGGGGGGGYIEDQDHSSTAFEGATRGMGDLIRSGSQANLNNSAAAINYSVARKNEIDNQKYYTQTYFQMRQINREARAAERGPRPSEEQLVRLAQQGAPKRLSPSELNTVTGEITWPLLLQYDQLKPQRTELDQIFAQRAAHGAISPQDYIKANNTVNALSDELKGVVQKVPPTEYMAAREFLKSLAFETQQLAQ